jgi:single-strand DNA-binding protein
MKTLNNVQLLGLLGNDPKIYAMANGTLVARFSLATEYIYRDKTNKTIKKITEWHSIIVLKNLAEIAERFLQKGTRIYIEGSLKTREYEDKEDIKRQITEIVGNDLIILSNGKDQPVTSTFNFKNSKPGEAIEVVNEA